ncbi:MAG: TIGR03560 family F420-dependent LLM class oxidoreductase [archaeon]
MLSSKGLKFAVHVPPEGRDFKTMKEFCQTTEKLGYDLFTMTDHFMNMQNPAGPENHPLECWTALAGLAAVTSKIALGPLVSCVNYRHPTVLAKMATTVDIISGGRLIFGIGAGWHEMEFNGFMGQFPSAKERLDGLDDAIQICQSMFKNKFTDFKGKLYSAKNTLNSPGPVQKPVPVMVGGSGEKRTLKIAAKYADISHLFSNSPQELAHKVEVLKRHCDKVKRDFSSIKIAVGLRPIMDPSQKEIRAQAERFAARRNVSVAEAERVLMTTAGEKNILNTIREYQRLGASLFTLTSMGLEDTKSFKDQIMSKISG